MGMVEGSYDILDDLFGTVVGKLDVCLSIWTSFYLCLCNHRQLLMGKAKLLFGWGSLICTTTQIKALLSPRLPQSPANKLKAHMLE